MISMHTHASTMIRYIFICSRVYVHFSSTSLIFSSHLYYFSVSCVFSGSPCYCVFKLNRFHQTMPNLFRDVHLSMNDEFDCISFLLLTSFRFAHAFNVISKKNLFNIVMFENLNRSTPLDQIQVNK